MKFEADDEEPTKDMAAKSLGQAKSNHDLEAWRNDPKNWQGDERYDSAPEVVVHDNSTDPNIGAISQHQQDSLSYLHDDPLHFLNHEVTKNWTQSQGRPAG